MQLAGGLALGVGDGKVYWTNPGADTIQRANLDGSGLENLVTSGLLTPRWYHYRPPSPGTGLLLVVGLVAGLVRQGRRHA